MILYMPNMVMMYWLLFQVSAFHILVCLANQRKTLVQENHL